MQPLNDTDYGTPQRASTAEVTLEIDGQSVTVPAGTSLTRAANGDCELQDMAGAVGLRNVRYGFDGANHLDAKKDESNPYFTYDPSKCIVCNRCVRACEETQGTFALTIAGRGFESRVAASENQPFMESECVSCG